MRFTLHDLYIISKNIKHDNFAASRVRAHLRVAPRTREGATRVSGRGSRKSGNAAAANPALAAPAQRPGGEAARARGGRRSATRSAAAIAAADLAPKSPGQIPDSIQKILAAA